MSFHELKTINQHWEKHTLKGNELFGQHQNQKAMAYYDEARLCSETLFTHAETAYANELRVVIPYRIAHHNLANTFWADDNLQLAAAYFLYPVWRIKLLAMEKETNTPLYDDANHEWQKALLAYVDFMEKTGQKLSVDLWKDETYLAIQKAKDDITRTMTNLN